MRGATAQLRFRRRLLPFGREGRLLPMASVAHLSLWE